MDHTRPPSQKFPAGLAGVLNSPEDHRDSAYFSSTDASSKHTSAASGTGILSPPTANAQHSPVEHASSQSPQAGPYQSTSSQPSPRTLASPTNHNGNMSVASMVSPTNSLSADPRRFDRPYSLESGPHSAGPVNGDYPEAMSRRESVDSRINQGLHDMRLGNSPYASHNQSTTSIHATLQQQRNPRPALDTLSVHRISNSYLPSAERTPEGHTKTMRIAPAITGPATSQIARAAEPTKGQAWAFPEEEIHRMPSTGAGSLIDSRRSSMAESFASSQYTTESRLPPGQRRFDESPAPGAFQRLSNASELSTVHHHSLQHKQLGDLRKEEAGAHAGTQPYSRTPELRVSHKLAERKRRTEMKELFEQLRELLNHERGAKASKWEILTKAISEFQRTNEIIRSLQATTQAQQNEIQMLRKELELATGQPASRPVVHPYPQDPYRPRSPDLPPIRSLQQPAGPPPPESMTGVQYDAPRINGFRPPEAGRY